MKVFAAHVIEKCDTAIRRICAQREMVATITASALWHQERERGRPRWYDRLLFIRRATPRPYHAILHEELHNGAASEMYTAVEMMLTSLRNQAKRARIVDCDARIEVSDDERELYSRDWFYPANDG